MIRVVYDVDDTLNQLGECVYTHLNISERPKRFKTVENKNLTKEQQEAIISLYANAEFFKTVTYEKGASDICKIEIPEKVEVWINSNNLTAEVAKSKLETLKTEIPDMNLSRIVLRVGIETKEHIPGTTIIVEDSLPYIMTYDSNVIKIIVNRCHNQSEEYGYTDKELGIIRAANLEEANAIVAQKVKELLQLN